MTTLYLTPRPPFCKCELNMHYQKWKYVKWKATLIVKPRNKKKPLILDVKGTDKFWDRTTKGRLSGYTSHSWKRKSSMEKHP